MSYVYIKDNQHFTTYSWPLSVKTCLRPQIEMLNSSEKFGDEFSRERG